MNDSEYNHSIWINDNVLSHEFHYAWSILAFADKWFSARYQRTAMMFHYASLTPRDLENRHVNQLAIYLKRNLTLAIPWHQKYADELLKVDCERLMGNLDRDADILINISMHHKNGFSKIYRKTLPDGMIQKIEKTISGLEKYFAGSDRPH
jgi:predicted acyltransferase